MPASTKKVPAKRRPTAAALDKGVAKVRAANAAKAAAKAAKAPRKGTLSAKLAAAETPESKKAHEANIAFARKVAKAAKPAATGAKAKILDMIAAKGGTSAAEVCKALGWVRAGATIGRAIKLAGFKVAKVRDADGVLRYSREG